MFGVHNWSAWSGTARQVLNNTYMRLWRRIADDPRFGKTKLKDKEVREHLRVPSLDCYCRKRMLKYFSRIARSSMNSLEAVLQLKGPRNENLPWVNLIIDGISVLKD